jgi:hypothetical protein
VVDLLRYQGEFGALIPVANGADFAIDGTMKYKHTDIEVSEVRLPGSPPVVTAEEAATYSLWGSFVIAMKRAFDDSVPLVEILDLRPKIYMYVIGLAGIAMTVGGFAYFFVQAFNATMNQKYLALSVDDGGSCDEVTRSISGSFSADNGGNWQGFEGFSNPGVQYVFELRESTFTTSDYENLLSYLLDEVQLLGELGKTQDMASNLILLSTWNFHCSPRMTSDCSLFNTQTIRMAAEAPVGNATFCSF